MNRRLYRSMKMLGVLLVVSTCLGWGDKGHKIVGKIAADNLTPQAADAVKALLKPGENLADVATWADKVKNSREFAFTRPMHYADVPDGGDEFILDQHCPQAGCVVKAINDYAKVLSDTNAKSEDRYIALKFLVHFVGDVHQPLHVGYSGDKGGNDIDVRFFDKKSNLHKVWDTDIIDHGRESWQDMAQRLSQGINAGQKQTWMQQVDPVVWANESFRLAVTNAYDDVEQNDELDETYYRSNKLVVEDRLAMAGVRLAALINNAFKDAPPPGPHNQQKFVGSKNSDVYHFPECKAVQRIAPHNLVAYDEAPAAKRLHQDCPWR